ncbi:MAG TPA: threonine-phosphate decarboxylase CobD [Methylocystis sp.]|nr:threonine-phosphate decarboxylase CobD [Methylocystis sp.]
MSLAQRISPPPASLAPTAHGGALDAARRRYPHAPEPWIDLSTGINPRAYPLPEIPIEAFTRLPDADATLACEAAAAKAYGVAPGAAVIAGPGSQAFIKALPRLLPARRVATLGFTYAEHGAAWRAAGAEVVEARDIDLLARADVAIVVNPNNPDGRRVAPAALATLAGKMPFRGGAVVVDEAFADFEPGVSAIGEVCEKLIVLRSFGKAYGLPGLRLGFAVCGAELAQRLRAELGPWAVSGPALAVAPRALADAAWLAQSGERLQAQARRLDALLGRAGFRIAGGTRLFRLAENAEAGRWFERLCAQGVLARRFAEKPNWLRFGVPDAPHQWERLAQALGAANV